jgi:hypothetical protein
MVEQNPTTNNITQSIGSINNDTNNTNNSGVSAEPPTKFHKASKSIICIQKEQEKQEKERMKMERELERERKIKEQEEKRHQCEETKRAKEQEKLRKQEERKRKRAEKELAEAEKREKKEKQHKEKEEKAAKAAQEKEKRTQVRAMKRAMKAGIASESFVKFMENKGINLNLDQSKQIKSEFTLDPENLNKILAGVREFQASRNPNVMNLRKEDSAKEEDKFKSLCQRVRAKFLPAMDIIDVDDDLPDDVSISDDSIDDRSLHDEDTVEDGSHADSEIEIPVLDDKELEILRMEQIELERQIVEMKRRAAIRKQCTTNMMLKRELELLQQEQEH